MASVVQIDSSLAQASSSSPSSLQQVCQGQLSTPELLRLLQQYRLLPQLLRELVIDAAIAPISCTFAETVEVCKQFYAQHQITNDAERAVWLEQNQLTAADLDHLMTRNLRLDRYKQATWGSKLESYFLQRKKQLDQVIYSLLRVEDRHLAQELYFRIQDGEQTFAAVVREFSQGQEVQTDGMIGPATLNTPHPAIAQRLATLQPGELSPPFQVGQWVVIVRLEKLIAAQFDQAMQQRLLTELFEQWVQTEVTLASQRSRLI